MTSCPGVGYAHGRYCLPASLGAERYAAGFMQKGVVSKLKVAMKRQPWQGDERDLLQQSGNSCSRFIFDIHKGGAEKDWCFRHPGGRHIDTHSCCVAARHEIARAGSHSGIALTRFRVSLHAAGLRPFLCFGVADLATAWCARLDLQFPLW